MSLSRGFIVNRVFAADKWLQGRYGRSITEAEAAQLLAFLEEMPVDQRPKTLDALVAYGDDLVRSGRAATNVARVIKLP